MSAATPEKCPWCSDAQAPLMGAGEVRYKCGSITHEGGLFQQHPTCEASVLRKRVEELEAVRELALDALKMVALNIRNELVSREVAGRSANQWPDVLNGCVSGGGVEVAIEALEKAKGRQ